MTCREARRYLSPYLDSELDSTATFEVSEHLRQCEKCRSRFEAERDIDQIAVIQLGAETLPDNVWHDIRDRIQGSSARRRRFSPLILAIAAALVLVLTLWQTMPVADVEASPGVSAIENFLAVTDQGQPFAVSQETTLPTDTLSIDDSLSMDLTIEKLQGHIMQLVSVNPSVEGSDGKVWELRLNCCGAPAILRFAKITEAEVMDSVVDTLTADGQLSYQEGGNKFSARLVGDFVVTAVSSHAVEGLLDAVRVN